MARPRVFISSTYYDLKNVRADLERYVRERGFEPVLHERGGVPYGNQKKLEEYCYKEVGQCDIVVAVIGGRYGSGSTENPYSIAQKELKTALEQGKSVYIFVESDVLAEYHTYEQNREHKGITYVQVDNPRIYAFLDEVTALPNNNPITPFETSGDITKFLQEQWAGLFQRLLQESARQQEVRLVEDLRSTVQMLNQMVSLLAEDRSREDEAVRHILLANHPLFTQLRQLLDIRFRVVFHTLKELDALLDHLGFSSVPAEQWDAQTSMEWISTDDFEPDRLLTISTDAFDSDGKLKIYTPEEWDAEFVHLKEFQNSPVGDYEDFQAPAFDDDDDLPF